MQTRTEKCGKLFIHCDRTWAFNTGSVWSTDNWSTVLGAVDHKNTTPTVKADKDRNDKLLYETTLPLPIYEKKKQDSFVADAVEIMSKFDTKDMETNRQPPRNEGPIIMKPLSITGQITTAPSALASASNSAFPREHIKQGENQVYISARPCSRLRSLTRTQCSCFRVMRNLK